MKHFNMCTYQTIVSFILLYTVNIKLIIKTYMVEEKLELFVSQIDAELLKSVHSEVLETKDVQDSCKYRKSKPQMSYTVS